MSASIITLLTDFGESDGFVGTMKGVIYGINPDVKIVDISHDIEPQNTSEAAFVLRNSYRYFPDGTIHVIVVDPGVGSVRRILCVSANNQYFVAPDTGVLKYIYHECDDVLVVNVSNRKYFLSFVSQTFHGRDIFSPVAAHLSRGVDMRELGEAITDYERGQIPELSEKANVIEGEVVHIDRFGNLISNIPFNKLENRDKLRVRVKNLTIDSLANSYAQVKTRRPVALIGSSGFLEVAYNLGNAKEELNCAIGEKIAVIFDD
ncbi:SAM-dependent chlorinase/fluorinase [candidate division KSB1 bacterium]|nr:SAM-dependent chlorinase/fluorinase [candidate division KSB1 bacterium]NIR69832.1 SAM-dependent chlorinase/fluorinase [candidate division KSB1 bacterium]NIS24379.1 SAM-dependent chlorinase/fluorinase [candidate division KSB1 bacterium]NIT71315.1 SAM-dependent chlorinase/fluorinase [candidate division KSB1 bacterium]NIU27610.1 SAM-dependent chlorinase/fluorinase [candidate division KSB1 bacterium]